MRLFSKYSIYPSGSGNPGRLTDVRTVKASSASGRLQTGHLGARCVIKEMVYFCFSAVSKSVLSSSEGILGELELN